MLTNEKVGLRARQESDVPVLHDELYNDVEMRLRADSRPWQPIPSGSKESPYAVSDPQDDEVFFSIMDFSTDELAGEAVVWGIDTHNRSAHLGISLRPKFRGMGISADVIDLLCDYAFNVRGLQRVQLATLADNSGMITTAESLGFVKEGVLRSSAWVQGSYVDQIVYGLLADEREALHPSI